MKVLIPLDGSKFAEVALESAASLVDLTANGVEVHLVKVVATGEGMLPHADLELGHKEAREYLERVAVTDFPESLTQKLLLGRNPLLKSKRTLAGKT